jgi:hypothetical protein
MSLGLDIQSILLLLIFIAPGFFFTRTYTAYRPRYYTQPDSFAQFILSIVGSAIIHATILTGIALGLLGYAAITGQIIFANTFIDPAVPLNAYPLSILAGWMLAIFFYLALSLVLARRFATFLGQRIPAHPPRWWKISMGQDPPEPFLLWHTILQIEPLQLDLIPPHLTIQLRSGDYFEGDLYQLRLVGDAENTVELALRNVARYLTPPGQTAQALAALPNQVLLLKSSDILWLTRNDLPR